MKTCYVLTLAALLILGGCASQPAHKRPVATFTFQNGESVTVKLMGKDPALEAAFMGWAAQGAYTQTLVYRQLPGIFVLTGKPRLAGNGFMAGQSPTPNPEKPDKKPAPTKIGQIGLVMHPDGTVGPEIILMYGYKVVTCCEEPANIAIGTITGGRKSLGTVQRGDNLQSIAIQP